VPVPREPELAPAQELEPVRAQVQAQELVVALVPVRAGELVVALVPVLLPVQEAARAVRLAPARLRVGAVEDDRRRPE